MYTVKEIMDVTAEAGLESALRDRQALLNPSDVVNIPYTSGTTGFPKGVMLSSSNALINTVQGMVRIEFKRQARVFCVLPLFHSFAQNACVWASIVRGCTIIVVPKLSPRAFPFKLIL